MSAREYLTAEDIARELQCSKSHAHKLMKSMVRLVTGRIERVTRNSFEAWLDARTVGQNEQDETAGDARARKGRTARAESRGAFPALTISPTRPRTKGKA